MPCDDVFVLDSHDALLIVDVQNDFLPHGALAIAESDKILPSINALASLPFGCVITSQDIGIRLFILLLIQPNLLVRGHATVLRIHTALLYLLLCVCRSIP